MHFILYIAYVHRLWFVTEENARARMDQNFLASEAIFGLTFYFWSFSVSLSLSVSCADGDSWQRMADFFLIKMTRIFQRRKATGEI
jgi:hypothetical protein